jgi:NAD(P)-dependent dehydrogenase (short-subunit alcohol dehydrogenase family)
MIRAEVAAMTDLSGKVALVTGAARGIGRAIALRLAAGGAAVAVADLDEAGARKVAGELGGGRALALAGDVSVEREANALVDRTVAELGGLDVLVNNAGIWVIKPLEETTPDEWDRQQATNLRGVYLLCRRAIPALRRGPGCIVNIASMAGFRFTVPHVGYAATKAGVIATTRDLAVELAPDRIRVNAVAPGPIDTQGLRRNLSEAEQKAFEARFLLGRIGRPEDIAEAVAFLASERASYITGATLPVTGGAELAVRPLL